jgi:MFS family permease
MGLNEPQSGPEAAAPEEGFPPLWVGGCMLGILILLGGVSQLDRGIVNLMVGGIKADLHVGDFQISLLQGLSFASVFAICGIPLGYAADRFPRRGVIFAGVFVWSLATMAAGLAQSFEHLFVARCFVGMGEAALAPAAYSMLGDLFPRRQMGRALAIYTYGAALGGGASLWLGGMVLSAAARLVQVEPALASFHPWQLGFIGVGAPGLLLALLIFLVPEPKRRRISPLEQGSWSGLRRFMGRHKGFFTCHFIGFTAIYMMAFATSAWTPAILMRVYGWTLPQVGLWFGSTVAVGSVVSLTAAGVIADFLFARGMRNAHLVYFIFTTAGILVAGGLMVFANTGAEFMGCWVLGYVGMNMGGGGPAALQVITPSAYRGRIGALYLLAINLVGLVLGPTVVALFTDFVFHDTQKVQLSVAATLLTLAPVAILALVLGLKPMTRAVLEIEANSAGQG